MQKCLTLAVDDLVWCWHGNGTRQRHGRRILRPASTVGMGCWLAGPRIIGATAAVAIDSGWSVSSRDGGVGIGFGFVAVTGASAANVGRCCGTTVVVMSLTLVVGVARRARWLLRPVRTLC